jgi:hypothetical protein
MKSLHSVARPATVIAISIVLLCGLAAAAETSSTLNKKEVKTLLATARTPSDHQKIAAYYHDKARRLSAKALEFSAQADAHATQPATIESKQGISCLSTSHFRHFAKLYAEEAKESETLALQQDQLAQGGSMTGGAASTGAQK